MGKTKIKEDHTCDIIILAGFIILIILFAIKAYYEIFIV